MNNESRTLLRAFSCLLAVCAVTGPGASEGRTAIAAASRQVTLLGMPVGENFDQLAVTGPQSSMPDGWEFLESLSNANLTYGADNGASNAGNTYSYGSAGSPDRALGTLRSSGLSSVIGGSFSNNSGKTVAAVRIAFTGEQWRLGSTGRNDRLEFSYSSDATSLASGSWAADARLNFIAPQGTASPVPPVGAQNGNASANRTVVTHTLTGLSLAPGKVLYLRWTDFDASGSDDGLALDDFSVSFYSVPDTTIETSPGTFSGSSASFTFASDNSGAEFECDLDGGGYAPCGASTTLTGLNDGQHTFRARAKNPAGTDDSPAGFTWYADATDPQTEILDAVSTRTNSVEQTVYFAGSDAGSGIAGYECRLDSESYGWCSSPKILTGLSEGGHRFEVRAWDAAGRHDETPAAVEWTVDLTAPSIDPGPRLENTMSGAERTWTVAVADSGGISQVTVTYRTSVATSAQTADATAAYGNPETVLCEPSGDGVFECTLPGQHLGTAVSYHSTATDTAGNSTSSPDPNAPNLYVVGSAPIPAGVYTGVELGPETVLTGPISVTGAVRLSGVVSAGSNTVTLGPDASIEGAGPGHYISGPLRREIRRTGRMVFPVGDGSPTLGAAVVGGYAPVDVEISATEGLAALTVQTDAAELPGATIGFSLARRWGLVTDGAVVADLTFHYLEGDVRGVESSYRVMKESEGRISYFQPGALDAGRDVFTARGVGGSSNWSAGVFGQTVARADIEGRVTNAAGGAIAGVSVRISGGNLREVRGVKTNQFGIFRFEGLETGGLYILQVTSRRHSFRNPTRVVNLYDSVSEENFIADAPHDR